MSNLYCSRLATQALILGTSLTAAMGSVAFAAENSRVQSPALTENLGLSGALLGGGSAQISDISALDLNPAGIAQRRQFASSGSLAWTGGNLLSSEAGVIDSVMSQMATGFKVRQTTSYTGGKDRRFTLGAAERLNDGPLLLGLALDYSQLERPGEPKKKDDEFHLRFGFMYALNDSIQLGMRSQGYFDNQRPKEHAVGISAGFAQYFIGNADFILRSNGTKEYLAGLTLSAREYIDLYLSYGYEQDPKKQKVAGGLSLKAEKIQLYYTGARGLEKGSRMRHAVGASIIIM